MGDVEEQVNAVLAKMADQMSKVIFGSWNKVFEQKVQGKSITLKPGIEHREAHKENTGGLVYCEINIKDGTSSFKLAERSLGFRWFFCFLLFTQFRSMAKNSAPSVFLFDEPASNLHSKAQIQLLDSFPNISKNGNLILYSTHSHYMINPPG